MSEPELSVLIVEDDFRVADMHAAIVDALPGFTVAGTANTLAAARKSGPVDLALVDVYLPDGSGIDLVRELHCDSIMLSAATEAETVRAAVAAGALGYLVKPFAPNRKILAADNLGPAEVDAALDSLRPRIAAQQLTVVTPSPTKDLVLQALDGATGPMSAAEVAAEIGVSRATAQRYLAALATSDEVKIGLRYGSTGRPEQEFVAKPKPQPR